MWNFPLLDWNERGEQISVPDDVEMSQQYVVRPAVLSRAQDAVDFRREKESENSLVALCFSFRPFSLAQTSSARFLDSRERKKEEEWEREG